MQLFTSKTAANYIGVTDNTLKNSRCTGLLLNTTTPKYLKLGNTVRYRKDDLDQWLSSLSDFEISPNGEKA